MVYLYFILLLGVCSGFEAESSYDKYWKDDGPHYGPIVRPCLANDINCIRNFFAHNAQCSPAYGPAPDPYKLKSLPMEIPRANLSFILNDVTINGFNEWRIETFYINKETDTLVFEVVFDSIYSYSPKTTISYYSKGKEPVILTDYAFITFRNVSLTMTVTNTKNIKLSDAYVYTYIGDTAPFYGMGPKTLNSKVPVVLAANTLMLGGMASSLQELFVKLGPVYFKIFLQTTVCDFRNTK